MSQFITPKESESATRPMGRSPRRSLPGTLTGVLLGAVIASRALAGGADVSTDEIYSDGVTLTTYDGSPLDIDGDGNMDLAVAGNKYGEEESSRYYLGNGDGTFGSPITLRTFPSSDIKAAPLNGDSFIDLVQGRRDRTDVFYLGNAAGGLNAAQTVATMEAWRTLSVAIGDLDNDMDLDLVTGNGLANGSGSPQANRFYLNDLTQGGAVAFAGADITTDADQTRSIALADLDGDGDLDVVVGNDETTPGSNRVYLNQFVESGDIDFAAGVDFGPPDDLTTDVLVGDLDDDGLPDIVVVNAVSGASTGENRFFLNTTAGAFSLDGGTPVSADTDRSNAGVLADFDGDGDLDLAVANFVANAAGQSSRNRLYLNEFIPTGTVSFAAALDISADEHMTHSIAAGDLDDDGDTDIIAGNEDDVPGVRDRRYLNNGTVDPFTNIVPTIDTQANVLETAVDTGLTIELDDVTVTDGDNVFPNDFTLTVQSGTNYTVGGNTITPAAGFSGDLTVPVIVNDGTDDSASFNLTVTVTATPVNSAPTFQSEPVTNATEGSVYTYDVVASDANPGDTLEITAPTLPAWLTLTDNGDRTATLSGTPAAGDVGDNDVVLRVDDGTDTTDQPFTITVGGAAGNTAPTFASTAVTDAEEGEAYTYDVIVDDPDAADTLEITAPTLPAWLTLTDNGDGTATLSGTPAAGDVGDHDVVLQVSDGTETADQAFTITVGGAAGNTAPTFASTAVTDAEEGETYTYDVTVDDPDAADTLEITAPTLPDWLTLTDNGDGTATLSGTPAAADVGEHDVSLQVSDGTDSALQDFTITVSAAPAPPPPPPSGGGGGGGSTGLLVVLGLLAMAGFRRRATR